VLRTVFQITFGGMLGIFLLLFFMANDDWVVIRLPSAPWHNTPSWPVYEARLFGVMIIAFAVGVIFSGGIVYLLRRRDKRAAEIKQIRINELEAELEKANRLMAAANKQAGE
jgi:hypothetical protein